MKTMKTIMYASIVLFSCVIIFLPGDASGNPGDSCGAGMIIDCTGNCELESWLGDGTCDNDTNDSDPSLADFTCLNNDNGDSYIISGNLVITVGLLKGLLATTAISPLTTNA